MPLNEFFWGNGKLDPMAALQQLTLLKALSLNKRDAAQIVLNRSGGGEITEWHWQKDTWPPSWAVFKSGNAACLVLTGTTNIKQIGGHLWGATGTPVEGEVDVYAHSIHYKVWKELAPQIRDAFQAIEPERYLISGHSYGGALAQLAACTEFELKFVTAPLRTQVMTFGQPRSFTTGLSTVPFKYFRLCNNWDPVPVLPPQRTAVILGLGKLKFTKFLTHNKVWAHYGEKWRCVRGGFLAPAPSDGDSTLDDLRGWANGNFGDHFIDQYISSIQEWLRKSPQNSWNYDVQLDELAAELTNDLPIQNPDVVVPQASYIVANTANKVYDAVAGSLWTQDNLQLTTAVVASVTDVVTRMGANRGDGGRTMPSGFWKITTFIGNGVNGDSQSVIINRPLLSGETINTIIGFAKNWTHQRALLFGFNYAGGSTVRKDQGCPALTYVRVADALNPRITQLVALPLNGQTGYATSQNTSADRLSTSVSFRMYAQRVDGLAEYANHCIVGQPDTVCDAGLYVGNAVTIAPGVTWDAQFRSYISWLCSAVNGRWGFMGQSATNVNRIATGTTLNAQSLWQVSVDTTGWAKGDTVLITRANAKGFNGQSKIDIVNATTLILLNKRIQTDIPAFTSANIRRVGIYGQPKPLDFFQYQLPPAGLTAPMPVSISKKDLGKEFNPTSFTKKRRRVA